MKKIITDEQKKEIGKLMLSDHADAICAYATERFSKGVAKGILVAGLSLLVSYGINAVLDYLQAKY